MLASPARRFFIFQPQFFLAAVIILILAAASNAQSTYPTDGSTPTGLKPGASAGSYSLSGFDNINLYNGNLDFRLPLLGVGGRGGAGHSIMLPIDQKWQVETATIQADDYTETHFYPANDWWQVSGPGYGPGVMHVRYGAHLTRPCNLPPNQGVTRAWWTLTRLTFTAADGTEYELRDQLTGGAKTQVPICASSGTNRGKVFVTADGSSATFISDNDITDLYLSDGSSVTDQEVSGYLLLRDGTRYRIEGGQVLWLRDRNGNKISFAYNGYGVATITDSLNRQVTIDYGVVEGGQYGTCDKIHFKGFSGASRVIRVCKTNLGSVLRPDYSLQSHAQLFPGLEGSPYGSFDPTVVSAVWLPDSDGVVRKYQFRYNNYGELARLELPTGAAVEYDHANGLSDGTDPGGVIGAYGDPSIYRRVIQRREYADGVNLTNRMTYSRPESCAPCSSTSNLGYVVVDQISATDSLLARQKHYFHGSGAANSISQQTPVSYTSWDDGREYQTEALDTNGSTPLRRANHAWQGNGTMGGLIVNPRILETTTTIEPWGAALVSKQTFAHDQYNNQTDVYEYHYGSGAPGALVRRSHTDYLTTNAVNGVAYDTLNPNATNPNLAATVHIRSLPKQTSVFDAGGTERARSTSEYDNYVSDANHAALWNRPNISGLDAAFTPGLATRGNATAMTSHLLVNGAVTGSISAYGQFDIAGNVVKVIDARGYQTMIEFDDRFGEPDGNAQLNSAPLELSSVGQTSYAFATKVTNAAGHLAYGQMDYYLGQPVDGQDPNGVVASGYFNDALDRPTQVRRAVGTDLQNQTTFIYDDENRIVTTTSDLSINNDNLVKSQSRYDNMGRTFESRQYEGGPDYIATNREYDALGRAYRISNPYRPLQGETAIWLTTTFDALGRTLSATTPDGAVVTTRYNGNTVTATDQTGKSRKSVTDALGRMIAVYEDPAGLNYLTSYDFDVLGNLLTVTQGTQTRTFAYDSLKRLTTATGPETGTTTYQYDNNSNLELKVDARGISTVYVYDSLNRSTSVNYSNTTIGNPDVPDITRIYDTGPNGKGRLRESYSGGAETTGSPVDHTKILSYDELGRPLEQRQRFKTAGVWSAEYRVTRDYDLAGGVDSQGYPSGRTVGYSYDSAGRTSSFTGDLGDGTQRSYSSEITYSPLGGLTKERLGTDTPVYNKLFYNSRGQLAEIRESTSYTGPTDTTWNRGALINHYSSNCWGMCGGGNSSTAMTDNNGNLKKQDVYVPLNDQLQNAPYKMWTDQYDYDSLNRLQRVHEYTGNTAVDWQQEFIYDRFGNRTIHQTNTWGAGISKKEFTVNTANNRLGVPGGQTGTMAYDAVGNLTTDTYSGSGVTRAYDAENRMTSETQTGSLVAGVYTYNADGRRVRRKVNGAETWAIYGMDGELLAEYAANAAPANPQKEYGYRNGQLLITADVPTGQSSTQNVSWTNVAGATAAGNSLTKTAATAWGNAGAASTQTLISGDGYVEFTASETSTYRMCGLSHGDSDPNYTDIDFAMYATGTASGSHVYVYESGVYRGDFGPYASGDTLRVAVVGGLVKYSRNGTVFYTSPAAPTYPLLVDTSLYSNGSTLSNVVISGNLGGSDTQNVSWGNSAGVSVSGNSLTKTAATAWGNAGAASTQSLISGDGYVEFTASETSTYRMCGLSHGDSDPNYTDIDFAMYATGTASGSHVYVYESGVYRGDFGPYASGDTLRVAVVGGLVKYSRNGTVFYTSTAAPTYPLLVDTSLYSNGSTLSNVIISGNLGGGGGTSATINWLVTDQLGTPRMVFDQTGTLANVKRHDYLPFGEELFATQGLRTAALGYSGDTVRQKFTGYEREAETGLDFAQARFYSHSQGRFSSPDPLMASATAANPQTLNRYGYVVNNPLKYVDPSGMIMGKRKDGEVGDISVFEGSIGNGMGSTPGEQQQTQNYLVFINGEFGTSGTSPFDNVEPLELSPAAATELQDSVYQATYVQVPLAGPGFYAHGRRDVQWGDSRVVESLLGLAASWNADHAGIEIGYGEMSDINGNTVAPHLQHLLGLRIDIRPIRTDGHHSPVTWRDPLYNRDSTRELIQRLSALPGYRNTLFNDPVLISEGLTLRYRGHDNHLHVTFRF